MPAGGELAALLARRAKVSDGEISGAREGADEEVNSLAPAAPSPAAAKRSIAPLTQPKLLMSPSSSSSPSPSPTRDPVHVTTPMRNDELKAVFEERNLEAGIPTPAFLVNARKNLKKPGSKHVPQSPTQTGGEKSDHPIPDSTPASFSDNLVTSEETTTPLTMDGASSSSAGEVGSIRGIAITKKNNSVRANSEIVTRRSRINASRSSTSSVSSHTSNSTDNVGPAVTTVVSSLSGGDMSVGVNDSIKNRVVRANSDSGYTHDSLAARRSRINASRTSISSVASNASNPSNKSNTDETADGRLKKSSPAQMRRHIMAAKIRTSRSTAAGGNENASRQQQQQQQQQNYCDADSAIPRTSIISPKRDEFEVLFADDDFVSPGDESMDSIVKEMNDMHESLLNGSYSTAGNTVTMPTNNVHRRLMIDNAMVDNTNANITPEKSRIHNASTPKIRGNGNYKRENYNDGGRAGIAGALL